VGASKRFSTFSHTEFYLAASQIAFLTNNFGITASQNVAIPAIHSGDPFLSLSLLRFGGQLTSHAFADLVLSALNAVVSNPAGLHRLRLDYLADICKVCLNEDWLSIFGIQFLEKQLSEAASSVRDRDQALQCFSLILSLRMALRDRIATVNEELSTIPPEFSKLLLKMEFANSYTRAIADNYLQQLATFCNIAPTDVVVRDLKTGSTFLDVLITTPTLITDVIRFIRYSLSLATVTISDIDRLSKAFSKLKGKSTKRKNVSKTRTGNPMRTNRKQHAISSTVPETVAQEMVGIRPGEAKPIEVFVDTAKERVLVVDGRVKVTISLV
jgi:hypothetical protein